MINESGVDGGELDEQALSIGIAVAAIQTQQPQRITSLKNFLASLPKPKQVEAVLAAAVIRCAESDPKSYNWIVQNEALLQPELDLVHWSRHTALNRLLNQGCVIGRDFRFESPNYLWLSASTRHKLFSTCTQGESIVLCSFLHIRS